MRLEILDVVDRADRPEFRGPAVQGKRGDRFVYLTWGNVGADGHPRCARVDPPAVLWTVPTT